MEEKKIQLTIDRHVVEVNPDMTLLEAAKTVGIEIPTLCHMDLKGTCVQNKPASCRLCVVEVEGRRNLAPACATKVMPGMVVHTNSGRVIRARKTVAELILSDHPNDCLTCPKCSDCELQRLVMRFNIREMPFNGGEQSVRKNELTLAIKRNMDKCIYCRRCESVCNNVQSVGVLGAVRRGFNTTIAPTFDQMFTDTNCTYCGQCVAVCPVGALTERDYTDQLMQDITDPDKVVIAQPAPAVRYALGEEFGMQPGTVVTGKLATALRDLGFDYVFDTDFGADFTIMEEAAELIDRLERFIAGDKDVKLPMTTSCCPAWVNFFENDYPDLRQYPSTCKSPAQMFGTIAKSYWSESIEIPRENISVISVMPCLAKKYECARDEFIYDGVPDVDCSITTRELAEMIRSAGIDFASLEDGEFDQPLGDATGAASIFGTTGGVTEAVLRTVYEKFTGKQLPTIEFTAVRGLDGIREASIDLNGFELKICVAHTLSNARILMDRLRAGELQYHFIEVMSCPGGCIGGTGQPYHEGDISVLEARQRAMYNDDTRHRVRKSHESPAVQRVYDEFLGLPGSKRAHKLLHTRFRDKSIL